LISANDSRDLQTVAALRADPEVELVRRILSNLGVAFRLSGSKAEYTVNKLLRLIDGRPETRS
jgi:hypothetical protein